MLIAGEPSGDMLAAELVRAIKSSPEMQALTFPPKFFGAGGPKMAEEGVEVTLDLTKHSVIGLWEAIKKWRTFKRLQASLVNLAFRRRPDVIICVDFSEFNRRLAKTIRERATKRRGTLADWQPKIVKYISPQVWASRSNRAWDVARDHDLLLSIFPFEKQWYADRVPELHVEFVGHPMIDRFANIKRIASTSVEGKPPTLLLLPGSRVSELRRHLPVMLEATEIIAKTKPVKVQMILPNQSLVEMAHSTPGVSSGIEIQVGGLEQALANADVAISKTGTVTMECALFKVPTVTLYKTSWPTYFIARQVVTVKYLTMANLLSDSPVYPEFVQGDVTAENLAREALDLLTNQARRAQVQGELTRIINTLGGPGASQRAAQAILKLWE
jgi:lipid-A-disaccharide synthase